MWIKLDVSHGFTNMIVADFNDVDDNTAFRLSLSSGAEIYTASLEFYPADSTLHKVPSPPTLSISVQSECNVGGSTCK